MDKLIILSIIAVVCGYIGIAIKRIYKIRYEFMVDFSDFINELIEEISFFRSPIIVFIERVMPYKKREFRKALEEYIDSIKADKETKLSTIYLKQKDKEIIQNCFNMIGRTDSTTQIFNLKNVKVEAERMEKVAKDELKMKGELFAKLGFLLGIALLILMI